MSPIINKLEIVKAVWPLQGKTFKNREELEDAVLPFFGPLQNYFQGQGHRDLVDWLLRSGCVVHENHQLVFKLPKLPTFGIVEPPVPAPPSSDASEITYNELQMILQIGSAPSGQVPISTFIMSEPEINSLVQKGLVQIGSTLPTPQREYHENLITMALRRAQGMIESRDFYGASGALESAAKAQDRINSEAAVYTLTDLGNSVREKLSSAKIKF